MPLDTSQSDPVAVDHRVGAGRGGLQALLDARAVDGRQPRSRALAVLARLEPTRFGVLHHVAAAGGRQHFVVGGERVATGVRPRV